MKQFIRKAKKFLFKKLFLSSANKKYISLPASKVELQPLKSNFLLITVVFNDVELIAWQYHSFRKLQDPHDYLVADTSSDPGQANAIEAFCSKNTISYVRLPKNRPGLDASLLHGMALNWAFYNLVKTIRPEYVGFLDPDLFVIAPGSFLSSWKGKDFWGIKSPLVRGGQWRLWPGFCFFRKRFYFDKNLNFLPTRRLDTGGGNFRLLKHLDDSHLILWEGVKEEIVSKGSAGGVQFFANVIHVVGGVSLRSSHTDDINKKREMAYNLVYADSI